MKSWRLRAIFLLSFPAIALAAGAKETIMLPMRDGVKLATDVHKRGGEIPARLPVILGRTPYNKNSLDAIGAEAIRRGFVFVSQDCRGRFASEGENLSINPNHPAPLFFRLREASVPL